MSSKFCLFAVLAGLSSQAFAGISFQGFSWRADSRFDLTLAVGNSPVTVRGSLRDGDKTQVKSGPLTVDLRSYVEGFVTIGVTPDDQNVGAVFVLERQNAQFVALNGRAILAKKSTLLTDMDGVVTGLKKTNSWDTALALRSMVSYFASSPNKQLTDFYDQVELGNVRTVAKPQPKIAINSPGGSRIPPVSGQTADGNPADPGQVSPQDMEARRQRWLYQQQQQQQGGYYQRPTYNYGNGYGYGGGYGYNQPQPYYRQAQPPPRPQYGGNPFRGFFGGGW